jgi:hypothetical protein
MYDKSRIDKFTGGQESLSIRLERVRAETMNMLDQQNLSYRHRQMLSIPMYLFTINFLTAIRALFSRTNFAAAKGAKNLLGKSCSYSGQSREDEQADYSKNNEGKHDSLLLDTMYLKCIIQLCIDRRSCKIKSKYQFI